MSSWNLRVDKDHVPNPLRTSKASSTDNNGEKTNILGLQSTQDERRPLGERTTSGTDTGASSSCPQAEDLNLRKEILVVYDNAIEECLQEDLLSSNQPSPILSIQQHIQAIQGSNLAQNMHTTEDWARLIIEIVKTNIQLSNESRYEIYSFISRFFVYCNWPHANLLISMERHNAIKSLVNDTDLDPENLLLYRTMFTGSVAACADQLFGSRSIEIAVLGVLNMDLDLFDTIDFGTNKDDGSPILEDLVGKARSHLNIARWRTQTEVPGWDMFLRQLTMDYQVDVAKSTARRKFENIGKQARRSLGLQPRQRITAEKRARIQRNWEEVYYIISKLSVWCSNILQNSSLEVVQTQNEGDSDSIHNQEPLFITLLTRFLKHWFSGAGNTNQNKQQNADNGLRSTQLGCLLCVSRLMNCLAAVTLLAVSKASSESIENAKRLYNPFPQVTTNKTLSRAFESIRKIKPAELRSLYTESNRIVSDPDPGDQRWGGILDGVPFNDKLTEGAGIFAAALGNYLSALLQHSNQRNLIQCHFSQRHDTTIEDPMENRYHCSVHFDDSFDTGFMDRIGKRAKTFLNDPSASNLISLSLGHDSSPDFQPSQFLSEALSLLSIDPATIPSNADRAPALHFPSMAST